MPDTPADTYNFTIDELIRGVEREITYRQYVYPNLCARGKMTSGTKNREIALMQAVLRILQATRDQPIDIFTL